MEDCLCHPPTANPLAPQPQGTVAPSRRFNAVRRALLGEFPGVIVAGADPIRQIAVSSPQALGNVIPEAWAIVSELLAFYDVHITKELFVGSAASRVDLQRLADLLGYLPRPSVASEVSVALVGSGLEIASTQGLALRASLPFSQVFEPDKVKPVSLIPRTVTLGPIRESIISIDEAPDEPITFLLEAATAAPRRGSHVLFVHGYRMRATEILKVTTSQGLDGTDYVEVVVTNPNSFDPSLKPALLGTQLDVHDVSILSPSQRAFTRTSLFGDLSTALEKPADDEELSLSDTSTLGTLGYKPGGYGPSLLAPQNFGDLAATFTLVDLDSVYRGIKIADLVIVQKGAVYSPHRIVRTVEVLRNIDGDLAKPAIPLTRIGLNPPLTEDLFDWRTSDKLIIHYNFHDIGRLMQPAHSELTPALLTAKNPLPLEGVHHHPPGSTHTGEWLLEDATGRGALVNATFNIIDNRGQATLTIHGEPTWSPALRVPVVAHPNVLHVTRGETVKDEVLGNGDPTQLTQSFQLKKSPLTYLRADGAENGIKSTLSIRVDGVLWHERRTFYGAGPNDQIYIVRQDDDEKSTVIFGDGVRGARLPAGLRNVRATYRHGAGAESPPFGNLTQIVRSVPGLTRVRNPVAASGGVDRESAKEIRTAAPASALILGRCVSLSDFSARVTSIAGVLNSKVELAWDEAMLAAVVKVWYVPTTPNDPKIAAHIIKDLQALAEPGTLVQAVQAVPIDRTLYLGLATDPDYIAADVALAVKAALLDPDNGILALRNTPIGGALSRSALVAAALKVPGVLEILNIQFQSPAAILQQFPLQAAPQQLWIQDLAIQDLGIQQAGPQQPAPLQQPALQAPGVVIPAGHYYDYSGLKAVYLRVVADALANRECCDLGA